MRQRPDDRVEQPCPVETGKEGRHGPWQEHQRLRQPPARKGFIEQQRQNEAEEELQENRSAGPPQRVFQRPVKGRILRQRLQMFEANETAGKRIEQLHIAKGIGEAKHQRHQHDGDDEHQHGRAVKPGFGPIGKPPHRRLASRFARSHRPGAMGIGHCIAP
ncbi:hypothetical protein D3C80_1604080 [compost metagenome]